MAMPGAIGEILGSIAQAPANEPKEKTALFGGSVVKKEDTNDDDEEL